MKKALSLLLPFLIISIILITPNLVYANQGEQVTSEAKMLKEEKVAEYNTKKEESLDSALAMKKQKLSEARLRICETKAQRINLRFSNMQKLGLKLHQDRVNLVQRVDEYYNNVLVPGGNKLNNYETLKLEMSTKEANLQAALVKVQESGGTFSCDSEDPKANADAFKVNVQAMITAHQEYKAATKNFIVSVKELSKQVRASKLSTSPVLSETPVEAEDPVAQ